MENTYIKGNICVNAPFAIADLDSIITILRIQDSKRPWSNHTKKGPGRKHQQGRAMTKQERELVGVELIKE